MGNYCVNSPFSHVEHKLMDKNRKMKSKTLQSLGTILFFESVGTNNELL